MAHPSARKGATFELECTKALVAAGVDALKVPLSGAVASYPGDVVADWGGQPVIMQMKCGKLSGYAKALKVHHPVIDRGYALVGWETFIAMLLNQVPAWRMDYVQDKFVGKVIEGHAAAPHDVLVFKQRYLKKVSGRKEKARLTSDIRVIIPPHSKLLGVKQ